MRSFLHKQRESAKPPVPEFYSEMGHEIRTIGGSYKPRAETVTWKGCTVAIMKRVDKENGEQTYFMEWKSDDILVEIFGAELAPFSPEALRKAYTDFLETRVSEQA